MRSPIQDANAGAAMDVAPTRKHAVRTATIAKQNNSGAVQRQQQINAISSTLGNALGNFMEGKRKTENEQRYMKAYHDQGTAEGLSEFQKDMKNTGFTELIYGGQTPEYQGALDASARNASNAMYIEEAEFIEAGGGDLTPDQYREHMQDKLTDYNTLNFSDAPDAAFAFMRNWKENSNELSKQQVKLYKVRQQEKARRTVAEGFQTDFDVYKVQISTNPNKAAQLGKDMYSGKNKPVGMSDGAYREVIVQESLIAARAHDYTALKLLNESGIISTFDKKEMKEYEKVRNIIDTDNFNSAESARLQYETIIENPLSSSNDVAQATQAYDSARIQVSARNTGSSKHMKTAFGTDRWRGVLGKQYQQRLTDEAEERLDARVGEVTYNSDIFDATLMQAEPAERRTVLADRLDDLSIAIHDPTLDREVRADLAKQFVAGKKKLEGWESADATLKRKAQGKIDKANQAELDLRVGVQSLITGRSPNGGTGGYTLSDTKSKKAHLAGAVNSIANQVLPDPEMSSVDKMEAIFSNSLTAKNYMRAVGKFEAYLIDSPEIKTALVNLGSQLRATNEEDIYTPQQQQQARVLSLLSLQHPSLYKSAFPESQDRIDHQTIIRAMGKGKHISETNKELDTLLRLSDTPVAVKETGKKVMSTLGLSTRNGVVQNMAFQEYKRLLPMGHQNAIAGTRLYMRDIDTTVDGITVKEGGTFGKVEDNSLTEIIKTFNTSYVTGPVSKSGFTRALAALHKNEKTKKGATLYNLNQVPNLRVSVHAGAIVLELDGRRSVVNIDEIEAELNGYNQRAAGRSTQRRR